MKRAAFLAILFVFAASGVAYSDNALMPDIVPYVERNDGWPQPAAVPVKDAVSSVETPAPEQPPPTPPPWIYAISRDVLADPLDVLRLVNVENPLGKEYPPDDELHALATTSVRKTSSSKMQLREIANDALERMFTAAEADGIKLYLRTGYRSYRTQEIMYYNRLQDRGYDDGAVQRAGISDHQTGLSADVISWAWRESKLNSDFAKTPEAIWMAENCARFGFILRYPQDKESIIGSAFEPWHLRYVGVEVAQYIGEYQMTLEEFTVEWKTAIIDFDLQSGTQATAVGQGAFSF